MPGSARSRCGNSKDLEAQCSNRDKKTSEIVHPPTIETTKRSSGRSHQLTPSDFLLYNSLQHFIMASTRTSARCAIVSRVLTTASSLPSLLFVAMTVAPVPYVVTPLFGPHVKARVVY